MYLSHAAEIEDKALERGGILQWDLQSCHSLNGNCGLGPARSVRRGFSFAGPLLAAPASSLSA